MKNLFFKKCPPLLCLVLTVFLASCELTPESPSQDLDPTVLEPGFREVESFSTTLFDQLKSLEKDGSQLLTFTLENGTSSPWEVSGRRDNLLGDGFKMETEAGEVAPLEVIPFEGSLAGGVGEVHLLFSRNWVHGYVNDGQTTYRLEPKPMLTGRASNAYVVYDADLRMGKEAPTCNLKTNLTADPALENGKLSRAADCWKMDIRAVGDYEYYAYKAFGDLNLATFGILANIYDASSRYDVVSLDLQVSGVIIFTSTSNPLYFPTASGNTLTGLLGQTRDFYNFFFPNPDPDADATLLYTGKPGGNVAGRAYLDQICRNNGMNSYGVIRTGYSATVLRNITAHEIGHLYGAVHPEDITGNPSCLGQPFWAPKIMASTVSSSSAAAFAPCAQDQIQWHLWFYHDCLGRGSCQ